MSYYDSESEFYEGEQSEQKELFRYDTSLLRAVQTINQWKQNISLPILQYLRKQVCFVQKQFQLFQCGSQVRALAFCKSLDKGLDQLSQRYVKAYQKAGDNNFDIVSIIKDLDGQLKQLIKYLHIIQANNVLNMYAQLYDQNIGTIYNNLRKIVDYCLDLNTLWLTLLTPKMFRQEQKDNLYKVNFGGTPLYYQKQILYLLDRIKRADIQNFVVFPKSPNQLLQTIALIINNQKLKPNLKTKIISLLKGQYYANKTEKTLKEQFILSSLQMYHGEEVSEIWDYQRYEDLCIKVIRQSFVDQEYIECTIYMEPENISFQRRTKTLELARIYYAIIQKIIYLREEVLDKQNKQEQLIEIPMSFIKNIMTHHNIQLVGHLYVNFLISNKNALSMNSPQLDKLLFGMIDDMKKIYLSLGSDNWCVPSAFLLAVTNRFLAKFSEDIKDQIVSVLPVMVKHIGQDKVPSLPMIVQQGQKQKKQYKCELKKITRAEQLMAIFCFIRDAEYKDQDFYLDLPQVTPTNFETAVMFIKSLELKLRHHEPTQDQKKLWIMIIEQSVYEYKIKVDLKWFKPKRRLDVEERQGQFLIHKQIKQKWAFDLIQEALNYRDQIKYDELVNNGIEGEVSIEGDLVLYFKYAVGININASRWSNLVQDYQLFSLLERMRSLLDINFGDIVHLTPDQLVTLNQLHLCLMFYNTKIQRAKGNQVYTLIVYKIIIPWVQSNDKKACEKFQSQFHQFFVSFIFQEYYLAIGDAIVSCLSNYDGKNDLVRNKIVFLMENLPKDIIISTPIDNNAELLQKIYSVLSDQIDTDTLIAIFLLIYRFVQCMPQLEDQYISLGFFVDFLNDPKKFNQFLMKSEELGNRQKLKINLQIVKKFAEIPQLFNKLSINQINLMLKTYFSHYQNKSEFLLNILDQIPEQKNSLVLAILKTFIAQKNKQQKIQKFKNNAELEKEQSDKVWKYWTKLEQYVDANCVDRKKQQEEVNLEKVTSVFEEDALKRIKQDYRKLLQQINKKKSSKKKSEKKEQNTNNQLKDKYKQAKIWRKVVKNFGTFEDVILFGQDPLEVGSSFQNQIYQNCLKVIQQRNIQQKYLKRIIRKLPILQKCAEDTITKIKESGTQIEQNVEPELLCKLIMINSRHKSTIIEQFILKNIHKIPIPIKIYQDYLALQIKKKLQNLPKDIVHKMLYEDLGDLNLRKIDELFDLIIYLPIKKFEHIYLKFDNKIQEKQEGWETQSENQQEEDEDDQLQQDEKNLLKKKSKKKSSQEGQVQVGNQIENMNIGPEGLDSQSQQDYDQEQLDEEEGDESIEEQENIQKSKIVNMFYQQHNKDLPKYKQIIQLRQQINVSLEQNYLDMQRMENKIKEDGQLEKKIFKVVDILQNQISQSEIVTEVLNKMPVNLYKILKKFGLTKQRNEQVVQKYRKQVTKMPRFINDYMSDRDENSENHGEDYEDQAYDEDDDLSEQSNSIDDLQGINDGLFFIVSEDGQLSQINAQQLLKNQGEESDKEDEKEGEQMIIQQKLSKDADEALTLPQLKQINSKIESQLTGKQLGVQEMVKILEISIAKLFSLNSYQLKHKPVLEFYKELLASKQGKIFTDTLLTVLRIDELYEQNESFGLAKKLHKTGLALSKALSNFLQIAYDISTLQSKESKDISKLIRDEVRELLPIGDQIMIKSSIPLQDNYLTMLVFYSRYQQRNVHDKLKKLLSSLKEEQNKSYVLNKSKASLLTKHIYKNNNSSSIWNNIQEHFGVEIQMKTKFLSCLVVYGKLLREDIQKCYSDLLLIVKEKEMHPNQVEDAGKQKQLLKQQQKKVEQNLRKHFKRIKHYYYWNKRNILSELDNAENKPVQLLKNNQLIKLTELMIFYCHFIKEQFFQKIDPKALKNLLVLPKSIIETSFMFLWKLKANIEKWQPLNKVKQYFKAYKLYEHKFDRLQDVCNLILEFLQIPQFSNSKFKQVIIPYFINHPDIAHEIPLIFKIPDIPEELSGGELYLTRQCSFDMTFYQWATSSFSVKFHNQQGSDHGGMVRQLMMGWTGMGIGEEHIFIGKILAFSFKKSIPYGGKFDLAMAIAITQFKVTIQFLEQVDPQICQSLKYVRDSDPDGLDMRFEITRQQFGVVKHYALKPGGQQIVVTNDNKKQFLDLFLANYYFVGRQWEMSELCTGFFSIVNKKYAAIFNPLEMIQKIQGQQINDYTKLKSRTKYEQGYTESSQMIKWFWQIVAQFNQKQMNRFLQFLTGAPKVSIFNHNFTFVIQKPYGQAEARLPVAHTCFNTLELPEYKTKEILQKKLLQAIFEGNDNFGIV